MFLMEKGAIIKLWHMINCGEFIWNELMKEIWQIMFVNNGRVEDYRIK